jgi:hypothetical protein
MGDMRLLVLLSGLIYTALTVFSALLVWVYGAFDCYESCNYDDPHAHWSDRTDAWQWDVLFWLGPATAATGLAASVLHAGQWRGRWLLLGLHGALLAVAGRLLADAQSLRWDEVAFWWVLIVGSGAAFGVIRQRLARSRLSSGVAAPVG